MLTLCRTPHGRPRPHHHRRTDRGLAPKIVELVGEYLQTIKARVISVLLIEQKLTIAMTISDRALVMGHGAIVFQARPTACGPTTTSAKEWLEV